MVRVFLCMLYQKLTSKGAKYQPKCQPLTALVNPVVSQKSSWHFGWHCRTYQNPTKLLKKKTHNLCFLPRYQSLCSLEGISKRHVYRKCILVIHHNWIPLNNSKQYFVKCKSLGTLFLLGIIFFTPLGAQSFVW